MGTIIDMEWVSFSGVSKISTSSIFLILFVFVIRNHVKKIVKGVTSNSSIIYFLGFKVCKQGKIVFCNKLYAINIPVTKTPFVVE